MAALPTVWFYTDFGFEGPYLGLMKAALLAECPAARVTNLMADAPRFRPRPAGVLLAALVRWLPRDALVVGVVDPGVGGERRPLLVEVDGRRFVGPDNGLFSAVLQGGRRCRAWRIDPSPFRLSESFHGRDLFAPAAGRLLAERSLPLTELDPGQLEGRYWPVELAEVIYIDGFGNAVTGLSGDAVDPLLFLEVCGRRLPNARTFSEVPPGTPFWYVDSLGLVEVAVNQGRADRFLDLEVGSPVRLCRHAPRP